MKAQNIYSIIHNNLRRMLMLSIGSSAIVFGLFSFSLLIINRKKDILIIGGIQLLIFALLVLLFYFFLVHRIKKTINDITIPLVLRASWLQVITSKLPDSLKTLPTFKTENIEEIDNLNHSIELLLKEILKLEDHIATVNFDRGQAKMAELVAHDIKGAIAILQLKIGLLPHLSYSEKQEFIECVNSIRDSSMNLLKSQKNNIPIPHFENTNKLISEIKITEGAILLVIDDDELIHKIWESKFKRSGIPILQTHHFLKPEDFNTWMDKNGHGEYGSRHYFFDYDLKNEFFNGLDLIERHGLALESIFIYGHADSSGIYDRATKLGVSCLRKDLLNDIPLKISKQSV